jgi:hypothetical protein
MLQFSTGSARIDGRLMQQQTGATRKRCMRARMRQGKKTMEPTRRVPGLVWTDEDAAIWRRFRRPLFGPLVLWSLADDTLTFELMRSLEAIAQAGLSLLAVRAAYVQAFCEQ